MRVTHVGEGKVVLIAGGGKCYTDIASRFVRSERSLEEILASPYDMEIVDNILNSGHMAATEFDYFLFGVEGFARPTEIQLVRKRIASYLIKSGRAEKHGKRSFDMVIPRSIEGHSILRAIPVDNICALDGERISKYLPEEFDYLNVSFGVMDILGLIEQWYDEGVDKDIPEEDLRYIKPQATEFKAIIGMNAHALIDWFKIRCCLNAQTEIRGMANQMLSLCKGALPDLFVEAGASCISLGYCPENKRQNKKCHKMTHDQIKELIRSVSA